MTDYEKKVFFWISVALLVSLSFILGFAVGETEWVTRIKAAILDMLRR